MSFNKNWLEEIKPMNVSSLEVNEWYRVHGGSEWRKNNWWFYKTQRGTVHILQTESVSECVYLYDFRWDAVKSKWVPAKSKLAIGHREFYYDYWYAHRRFVNFNTSKSFASLLETVQPKQRAYEISRRVYWTLQEFSAYIITVQGYMEFIVPRFADGLIHDFGIFATLATFLKFFDAVQGKIRYDCLHTISVDIIIDYMRKLNYNLDCFTTDFVDVQNVAASDIYLADAVMQYLCKSGHVQY